MYIVHLTDEQDLRAASGSEVCGIDWEPVSLGQGVEDAELDRESYANAVRALHNYQSRRD